MAHQHKLEQPYTQSLSPTLSGDEAGAELKDSSTSTPADNHHAAPQDAPPAEELKPVGPDTSAHIHGKKLAIVMAAQLLALFVVALECVRLSLLRVIPPLRLLEEQACAPVPSAVTLPS